MTPLILDVTTPAETDALGHRLAQHLFPGAVIALIGTLGAGKTHLVRAIASGLGIRDPRVVSSPTFVLIQEYDARLPIYHFDVYRLQQEADFADLGAHEYFEGQGICLVEWADKVPHCLPKEYLEIRIEITGAEARRLTMVPHGERYQALASGG